MEWHLNNVMLTSANPKAGLPTIVKLTSFCL